DRGHLVPGRRLGRVVEHGKQIQRQQHPLLSSCGRPRGPPLTPTTNDAASIGHAPPQEATVGSTGSSIEILVPPRGGLSSVKRPPRTSIRSSRPVKPDPLLGSASPTPSSTIVASSLSPLVIVTEISDACECLIAFVSASETT